MENLELKCSNNQHYPKLKNSQDKTIGRNEQAHNFAYKSFFNVSDTWLQIYKEEIDNPNGMMSFFAQPIIMGQFEGMLLVFLMANWNSKLRASKCYSEKQDRKVESGKTIQQYTH